ncbi:MAG: hypothetical protein R2715_09845 [Ilumatobacteraceae bacterium]
MLNTRNGDTPSVPTDRAAATADGLAASTVDDVQRAITGASPDLSGCNATSQDGVLVPTGAVPTRLPPTSR